MIREDPVNLDAPGDDERQAGYAARVTAMWDWYLEWSAIARGIIRDRRQLRALGFAPSADNAGKGEEQ